MIVYKGEHVSGRFNLGAMIVRGQKERFAVTGTFTAEHAEEMLIHNTRNRPMVASRYHQHANSMTLGRWILSPQSIAFTRDGVLLDGQQRLKGITIAQVPVELTIWFGCEEEEFEVCDVDIRPRTAAQVLSLKGYENAIGLCASARLVSIIQGERIKGVNEQWRYAEGLDQVLMQEAMKLAKPGHAIGSISTLTLAYYWIATKTAFDKATLGNFWSQITTGIGIKNDKFQRFRVRLITDKIKSRGSYTTQVKVAGQIVEAWNSFVTRKSVSPSWNNPNELPEVK